MSDNKDAKLKAVEEWWATGIINMRPGTIEFRGYPIQDLIGRVSFTQMIWLLLRGDLPSEGQAALLDAALMASVDHGPHAPSIAIARMAVSSGVDLNNAMASATNVLGDSHGGAGEQCMELFYDVRARVAAGAPLLAATNEALDAYQAERGKIVAGFGHRFHPIDPRSAPLLSLVERASEKGVVSGEFVAIGCSVEAALKTRTGKNLPMNIDGATAVIFAELGFAPPLGRGLFVLSRSVGILAHAWEEQQGGVRNKGPVPRQIEIPYKGPAKRSLPDNGEE